MQAAEDLFLSYGYVPPANFQNVIRSTHTPIRVFDERNNVHTTMSLAQLRYQINNAATPRQPYIHPALPSLPLSTPTATKTGFTRWCNKQDDVFKLMNVKQQKLAYKSFKQMIPYVQRRVNGEYKFNTNVHDKRVAQLYGLLQALKTVDYTKYDVYLTLYDAHNRKSYIHLNANTINHINILTLSTIQDENIIEDSSNTMLNNIHDVVRINIEYKPVTAGTRVAPGFFPYINKSSIDLSLFGIYSKEEDIVNESCLLTAIRSSNILNVDDMKLLASMIKTRNVLKSDLKEIANTFDININVKTVTDISTNKTSHEDIIINKSRPTLKLLIMYNHYMLNKTIEAPMYNKRPISIITLVKRLMNDNLLEPLSSNAMNTLIVGYKTPDDKNIICDHGCRLYRPPVINNINNNIHSNIKPGKRLFGYTPDSNEIEERLDELQRAINKLPLRKPIDVHQFYSFSTLGQHILYERGCFDNVYELTGKYAHDIRNSIVFPKTKTPDGQRLYSNKKLYYLDMNAAYMSFVKYIPTGKPSFNGVNKRIEQVIKALYKIRMLAKRLGKDKLATTIKYIMNASLGYSIKKPCCTKMKTLTPTLTEKLNTFIFKINPDTNNAWILNGFVPSYSCPQLAKAVLDEYNTFMNKIKAMVNVYYENIDAILTDQEGYDKLMSEGLIGDDIGQFKLERVFTEIAILSSRRYVATTIDGEQLYHCIDNKKMSYNWVVDTVMKDPSCTLIL